MRDSILPLFALLAALLACGGGKSSGDNAAPATPAEAAQAVNATDLMADYKANEVRADGKWKGKLLSVSGVVGDIKKDILDQPYVILGSGAEFEIPEVQCTLKNGQEGAAAALSKGTKAAFKGRVKGLMLNVQLEDCELVPGGGGAAPKGTAAAPAAPKGTGAAPPPAPKPAAPAPAKPAPKKK